MKPAKSAKSKSRIATNRRPSLNGKAVRKRSHRSKPLHSAVHASRNASPTADATPRRIRKDLVSKSKSHLLRLARKSRVPHADRLTKSELIGALLSTGGHGTRGPASDRVASIAAAARRTKRPLCEGGVTIDRNKRLDGVNGHAAGPDRDDRVVVMVRDPYWLHVYWEISTDTIQRTEVALGADWYKARPVLRLLDESADETTTAAETVVRDIEIHGGVNNWYIDLDGKPRSYRVDVGYRSDRGRFHAIARSNIVTPPRPGTSDRSDEHFRSVREECERIFALSGGVNGQSHSESLQKFFEEKFRRPLSAGSLSNYGSGALGSFGTKSFHFEVDAELIVFGKTVADGRVTIGGEPVRLRRDGSFTLRMGLNDGRQILRATAHTSDGIEERTIVLAVERNMKELEPMIHDGQEP